jgi:transcriptional regulatory protein RtcR
MSDLAVTTKAKPIVVIGFLGTQLDSGQGGGRWEKWRPSVALAMHEDMLVERFELLVDSLRWGNLAAQIKADIGTVSPSTLLTLHDLALPDPWDFGDVYARMHAFVRGYAFEPEKYDYLVHITTGSHVAQICWFALTEAHFVPGRLLQTSPAQRQKTGKPGSYSIIDLDLSKYDQIAQRFAKDAMETTSQLKSGINTRSASFNKMIEQIEKVAVRSKSPILLVGPTGAGKSMLAKNLYAIKQKQHGLAGRFVEINCATLRGDTAGSALFGHVRGAFTGAAEPRAGLLKSADGGLLFLDEIGELGLDEQAMVLRAIEDKRFLPMGSDKEVSSDFQLLAGTNRDLIQAVQEGRFREDLFARLNLWTYYLPGLKERAEDIEPNLEFELARFAASTGEQIRFNAEARIRYLAFAQSSEASWPGNFRDLGASITRLATLAHAGRINVELVDEEIARLRKLWGGRSGTSVNSHHVAQANKLLALGVELAALDRFDRAQLLDVLDVCQASKTLSDAGRTLFQASRAEKVQQNDADRLRKYLARFELRFDQIKH